MKRFEPNINSVGRLLRASGGLFFTLGAVLAWPHSHFGATLLAVAALFMFFEAGRGWCAARACGINTPL